MNPIREEEEPDAGFEDRLWKNIEARLPPEPLAIRARRMMPAATLVLAIAIGVLLGRASVEPASAPGVELAGERVLAVYVSDHLATAERVLLIAANSPNDTETARELARSLVASHRLYAIAAERAGRHELALFLKELEPVLLQLANSEQVDAVRESIVRRDLPFKTRTLAAAARRDLAL